LETGRLESDLTFTCIIMRKRDGLGITLVFGKLVNLYQELSPVNNENARMTAHYCGSCLVFVLCGFASFDADLVLCVHELEQVERYLPASRQRFITVNLCRRLRVAPDPYPNAGGHPL
jgi:hypothetical protein